MFSSPELKEMKSPFKLSYLVSSESFVYVYIDISICKMYQNIDIQIWIKLPNYIYL
jgi:hypothetical protein